MGLGGKLNEGWEEVQLRESWSEDEGAWVMSYSWERRRGAQDSFKRTRLL